MDNLERLRVPVIAALLVVFVAGLAMLTLQRGSEGRQIEIILPSPTPRVATQPREVKVYVSGAVARPGVYSLREGDRIEDAVKAAGGAQPTANLSQVNLARRIKDELQIHIPQTGEALPASAPGGQSQLININTASREQLDTLWGIGPTRAKNIVDSRSEKGPFKKIEELVERKLIPRSTFDRIKDLITAD
ncbi:MAG: helix-hairpin-helix domain-containing protein [Chloroflexi bacterium]|nr:helix-hairpin-helix domain-containing protein [Chloroflexota bacterium]